MAGMVITFVTCRQERYVQGKRIYDTFCLNCHMEDGNGLGTMYPNITESPLLRDHNALICLILQGTQSKVLHTVTMPQHSQLTPAGMSNLINYMSDRWGDKHIITLVETKLQMKKCQEL